MVNDDENYLTLKLLQKNNIRKSNFLHTFYIRFELSGFVEFLPQGISLLTRLLLKGKITVRVS